MKVCKTILLFSCLVINFGALGQKYLGLSVNLGNQFKMMPPSEGLRSPVAVSGNLDFTSQEKIVNNWVVQSSVQAGVLGNEIEIVPYDTLTNLKETFSFFSYSTFYGRVGVQIGNELSVRNRTLTLLGGVGGTYYYSATPKESIGVSSVLPDGSNVDLFDAVITYDNKSLIGFVKFSTLLQLSSSWLLGLGYSYHFKPVINGQYQFYHTSSQSSGNFSINQNELSAIVMFKFSKEKLSKEKALSPIKGRGNFYLGFETSLAYDRYKIEDNGDYIIAVPLQNITWGFNVRKDLKSFGFIETGFIYKYYWEGIGFKNIPTYGSSSGDNSWLVPLRLGIYSSLYKKKVYLVPVIGYTFGINPPFGSGAGAGSYSDSNTVVEYQYVENPNISRFYSLIQTGVGIEILLYNSLLFSLSVNYYSGFNTTTHLDIVYTVDNSLPFKATAISKGQFGNINFGLKYSFGHLFNQK